MNNDLFNCLVLGDKVLVEKSGKIYRVEQVTTVSEMLEQNARFKAGLSRGHWPDEYLAHNNVHFIMQRNGQPFGPIRRLKPSSITLL